MMFDTAELGRQVGGAEFRKRERALRTRLLTLQYRTLELARFPVIVDFAGVDGAGKGTTVNMINTWLDPRFIRTIGYTDPTPEEQARPRFWRYWRDLPPKGRTGLYLSGRYSRPLTRRVYGEIDDAGFDARLAEIIRFENALADDGALIIKFWMHLGRADQEVRLQELSADPLRSYRINENARRNHERYEDFVAAAEKIITRTNRAGASWTIVEGSDTNFRHLAVGEQLAAALERHLDQRGHDDGRGQETPIPRRDNAAPAATVFDKLDLTTSVDVKNYRSELARQQARLGELGRRAAAEGQSTVLVFEGPDASGKGGAIRRAVWSLDARAYRVHQFAAPNDLERSHHYLWRFWRRLPRAGHVVVFDRSWYGRVLVERAECFAAEAEWRRAYNEINDFEAQIVGRGILLLKFWLQISSDEQLARFEKRAKSPYKRWKLTDEDWRNRDMWDTYQQLGHEMVRYTSTGEAPWILVEGNDKRHARLKVLDTINRHLAGRLG